MNFVLVGTMPTICKLLELKLKRETAREQLERELKGRPCHFSDTARCNVPENLSCSNLGNGKPCPVWLKEVCGIETEKGADK